MSHSQLSAMQNVSKFLGLLIAAWCTMTFTHELGHILCGWSCGGCLTSFDLWPWRLPFSIFDPDPRPLITLWGGPLLGVFIPLVIASIVSRPWAWFIAHFCILANGVYLATAWVTGDRFLDTPKLLEHGTHPISIALYCIATIGVGYPGFRNQCVRMLAVTQKSK
jgi:hypothetical protein